MSSSSNRSSHSGVAVAVGDGEVVGVGDGEDVAVGEGEDVGVGEGEDVGVGVYVAVRVGVGVLDGAGMMKLPHTAPPPLEAEARGGIGIARSPMSMRMPSTRVALPVILGMTCPLFFPIRRFDAPRFSQRATARCLDSLTVSPRRLPCSLALATTNREAQARSTPPPGVRGDV